jgi:5-methylcytosine-specific restriction enzyme subunit McrC
MTVMLALASDEGLVSIALSEWERVGAIQDKRLKGLSLKENLKARNLADVLRPKVDIGDDYEGLQITSTSFVGCFDLGPVRISIRPKLSAMPLACLLRYAYGLRDLANVGEETVSPTEPHGLQDLLVSLLAAEVEELVYRGLPRRYRPTSEALSSPRGRILVSDIVRQGGLLEARLPCEHFRRQANWQLNQVLRSGLDLGAGITDDRDLRRRVQQLSQRFFDVDPLARLDKLAIEKAARELTRLTEAVRPALTLIRLLQDNIGVAFNSGNQSSRMPGFLFDMNVFFQRLLSRLMHDHLLETRIADEQSIQNLFSYAANANPRKRSAPTLRPDFALFHGNSCLAFLDAKYRDVWTRSFDPSWLYQLSAYALASARRVSIMLYATMAPDARDQQIDVCPPAGGQKTKQASIILRPVSLPDLAHLISSQGKESGTALRSFADRLVALESTRAHAPAT